MSTVSKLELLGEQYRQSAVASNDFNEGNKYGSNSPYAMSPKGEGQNEAGVVGTASDIQTRIKTTAFNRYGETNKYNSGNPDALSNGDEFGKGQVGDTGAVGSKTDILSRIDLTKSNPYSETKPYQKPLM